MTQNSNIERSYISAVGEASHPKTPEKEKLFVIIH